MSVTESEFYIGSLVHKPIRASAFEEKNVLFFKMSRPASTRDPSAPVTNFDGRATREHVEQYRDAYKRFRKANPKYRCPWPELEVNVEPPKVEAPAVEAAEAEESPVGE